MILIFLGIVSSAACKQIYGVSTWNAWDICNLILANNFTANWRVGLALFGIVQCFGTVATNLFANSIPFGCDWAGVFPKKINIIRGQVICMVFSWAICPWSILTSGAKFIIFLGSYTVFMASFMGILLADYFIIRRGNIHIPSLYDADGDKPNPNGLYYAQPKGFELKAFAAWIIGIALPLPGLAYSYTTDTGVGATAAKRMYSSGFLISFFMGGLSYLAMCYLMKRPESIPIEYRDTFKPTWEALGKSHGYFPGEPEVLFGRSVIGQSDIEYVAEGMDYASRSPEDIESGSIEEKNGDAEKDVATQVMTRPVAERA